MRIYDYNKIITSDQQILSSQLQLLDHLHLFNSSEENCSMLFDAMKPFINSEDNFIFSIIDRALSKNLRLIVEKFLEKEDEKEFSLLLKIIEKYLKNHNAEKIKLLQSHIPKLFKNTCTYLAYNQKKIIDNLLKIKPCDYKYHAKHLDKMTEKMGKIDYDTGLIILAQIALRKQYKFSPTLLENKEKFLDYIESIQKELVYPEKKIFVISGIHWVSGCIMRDEKGLINLIWLDSLFKYIDSAIVKNFESVFPENKMYSLAHQTQNSSQGCSVFALYNVIHLYTIEKYIKEDLASYCKNNLVDEEEVTLFDSTGTMIVKKIAFVNPPLPFILTTQSRELLNFLSEAKGEYMKKPVNKKGELALTAAKKHFKKGTDDKEINTRINYQFEKFAFRVSEAIALYGADHIEKTKDKFRLQTPSESTLASMMMSSTGSLFSSRASTTTLTSSTLEATDYSGPQKLDR